MKTIILIVTFFLSAHVHAGSCTDVVKYDQENSKIYVVCPELPNKTNSELGNIVYSIFTKNNFPPDEYTIDFVTSKEFLTQQSLTKGNHVGFYYTHDNGLIIWPKNKEKKRHVQLRI